MEPVGELLKPERLQLPAQPRVTEIKWHDYVDSLGDPSLRIDVILADDTPPEQRRWKYLGPIEDRIFEVLESAGERRFPYVRILKESEVAFAGVWA